MTREVDFRKRWKIDPDRSVYPFNMHVNGLGNLKAKLGRSMSSMRSIWPNLPPDTDFSKASCAFHADEIELFRSSSIQLTHGPRNYSANVSFSEFGFINSSGLVSAEVSYTCTDPEYLFLVILNLCDYDTSGLTIFEHQGYQPSVNHSLSMTWGSNRKATIHDCDNALLNKLEITRQDFTLGYSIALMGEMLNPNIVRLRSSNRMIEMVNSKVSSVKSR